jgi:hypothetical protein
MEELDAPKVQAFRLANLVKPRVDGEPASKERMDKL